MRRFIYLFCSSFCAYFFSSREINSWNFDGKIDLSALPIPLKKSADSFVVDSYINRTSIFMIHLPLNPNQYERQNKWNFRTHLEINFDRIIFRAGKHFSLIWWLFSYGSKTTMRNSEILRSFEFCLDVFIANVEAWANVDVGSIWIIELNWGNLNGKFE